MSVAIRRASRLGMIALATACMHGAADSRAERVVCVSKQINEDLFAIGADSALVGRDLTSVYPPQIVKITSVGYHRALNAEGIIALKPTLFLNDGNYGPAEVTAQIQKVGIPIVTMSPGKGLDSAELLIAALGQRFHHEAQADTVVAAMKRGLDSTLKDTAQWIGKPHPRVLIMHMGQVANSYLGLSRGSLGDQMLHWAGGDNAIDSAGRMARLTPELIAKANPDVILATDVGFDRMGSAEKFATMPGVNLTKAGKSLRIYRIPESEVMWYGPRTADAIRDMERLIHQAPPAK